MNGAVMLPGGHRAFCKGWKAMLGKLCLPTELPGNCTWWSRDVLSSTLPCSLEIRSEGERKGRRDGGRKGGRKIWFMNK